MGGRPDRGIQTADEAFLAGCCRRTGNAEEREAPHISIVPWKAAWPRL